MKLPVSIQIVSLPFLVVGTLLLWTGVFFVGFFSFLPKNNPRRMEYLLFGLTSLSVSLYAFLSFCLYSSTQLENQIYLGCVQFALIVPIIIFFFRFSAYHLGFNNTYFRWILPLVTLAFLPFFFIKGLMLQSEVFYLKFEILGHIITIPRFSFGPAAYFFLIWAFGNAFIIGIAWCRYFFKKTEDLGLLFSFILFLGAAIHDTLGVLRIFHGPDLFTLGFCGFLIAMAVQLFSDHIDLNNQLEKKKQELEKINDEMRLLVGTISHDVMAPLVSISGFTDLLIEPGDKGGKVPRYLERIRANTDHMKALLNDLVVYLRVGRVEEDVEDVSLKNVVHQVLSILNLTSQYPKAKIKVPEEWPEFVGSSKRIKQILLNLFQNSLKYAEREDIKIVLKGEREREGILFSVEDNGPGIPKDLQKRVFETFYRYSSDTVGTGLGLSIVKKVVETFKGEIWIDESYVGGARICFYLPSQ